MKRAADQRGTPTMHADLESTGLEHRARLLERALRMCAEEASRIRMGIREEAARRRVLMENTQLKKRVDELMQSLEECVGEKEGLEQKLAKHDKEPGDHVEEEGELENRAASAMGELKLLKRDCERLEAYNKSLERELQRCIQRRDARKLVLLAGTLRIASKHGAVTPMVVAKELGISINTTYDYLKELLVAGMLRRRYHGYYEPAEEMEDEGLEEKIALRLARKKEDGSESQGKG